ncbi:MAG: TetR/AcrR family transcriptional regulator [Polyangiaceae bacterium]|nr:TetR/AcrR family transcriptional regulator [Myxococcales bacterium]MCB9584486.1 TetR/AcrR family transcriptional regulator [Polyangiaceae bacterium]MCB9609329.1 TetR/AcrR family transcriptional regulator [Polyangiaceae bacterium]
MTEAGRPTKRDAILAAAVECFAERGFHGTAVPEIAKRARVSTGTLYHYFSSKEELVNSLYRGWKQQVWDRVYAVFDPDAGAEAQFSKALRVITQMAVENPAMANFVELHNHAAYLDDESLALDKRLRDLAQSGVVSGQSAGILRDGNPVVLMEAVFGAFAGVIRAHLEGRIVVDDRLTDYLEGVLWSIIAKDS